MGREVQDDGWRSWLETVRTSSFLNVKVWGLTPFWLRKDMADASFTFDAVMTLPIHREQLYGCVFPASDRSMKKNMNEQVETCSTHDGEVGQAHGERWREDDRSHHELLGPLILIVEDNPINQKVAAGLFKKLGCQVYVAESGDEALSLVQEHPIDVVMMDWELPGMNGIDTAWAIRELENEHCLKPGNLLRHHLDESDFLPCAHLPIVGMTAHGHSERNSSRWECVMDDCLAKPVHLQDLAQVLERWVGYRVPSGESQVLSGMAALQTKQPTDCTAQPLMIAHELEDQRTICELYDIFKGFRECGRR